MVDHEPAKPTKSVGGGEHTLRSLEVGESQVEKIAQRCETRRNNRIPISHQVRARLMMGCRAIAKSKGYEKSKIYLGDLVAYRESIAEENASVQKNPITHLMKACGFIIESENLLQVLDHALKIVREIQLDNDDWFYFADFGHYHTKVVPYWPWMRSEGHVALFTLFFYYLCTPIFFCLIMGAEDICVEVEGKPYSGWMSSLYFASTTLSTVGYGDLSVLGSPGQKWETFIGALYMIISVVVAVQAFSAAADSAFTPVGDLWDKITDFLVGDPDPDAFLYPGSLSLELYLIVDQNE